MYPTFRDPIYGGPYGAFVPYGSLNLTNSSPAQTLVEPLTRAEMKSFLFLPELSPADTDQDATIDAMISAARREAEILQNQDLVRRQWDLSMDYWPANGVFELRAPLVSVDLVQYKDANGVVTPLVEGTDYVVDAAKQPGLLVPAYGKTWPTFEAWPSSAILVRFTSGHAHDAPYWGDAGPTVKVGMKKLIFGWYNGRIPWAIGAGGASEYPWSVTVCLSHGALPRVK